MTSNDDAPFPTARLAAGLMVTAVVSIVLMWVVLPHWTDDPKQARTAVALTGCLVVPATWLGVVPLVLLVTRGPNGLVIGWMVGGAVRVVFSLASAIVLILLFDMPALPVLLTVLVLYLTSLAVETYVVLRFVNRNSV